MSKHWTIFEPDPNRIARLSKRVGCTRFVARLLFLRGIRQAADARLFLQPSLRDIRPPFKMKDMETAVQRIHAAIAQQEKILIFSDYDVDGITAAAVLMLFLKETGANVSYYIPHRISEGYGLRKQQIRHVATERQIKLIITADCGSTSIEAVDAANEAGIDVIITDHHHIPPRLPNALAILNPKRVDCLSEFSHLAGVGIAFMLVICLRTHLRRHAFWQNQPEPNLKRLCDLVALGTIADAVPLTRENRILTEYGLKQIQSGDNRAGMTSLLQIANSPHRWITVEDIAFRIVPRLNAAGRMAHAQIAVELLTISDSRQAADLVKELNRLNDQRKATEAAILNDVERYLTDHPEELAHSALVLHSPRWHEGVLGIVASRLVDRYHRPVVMISIHDGVAKGSARGVPGINLFECLQECADWLEKFGGHAAAAGLRTRPEYLLDFKTCFRTVMQKQQKRVAKLPDRIIDAELQLADISPQTMLELDLLRPFGPGNPEPLFMARNIQVVQSQLVGKHHRRMLLRTSHGNSRQPIAAIEFNVNPEKNPPRQFATVAFHLRWNHWRNTKRLQLVIQDTEAADIAVKPLPETSG